MLQTAIGAASLARRSSGEEAVPTEATQAARSDAAVSDAFSRAGANNECCLRENATLGEETVFAEMARVESSHAAMPCT